MLGCIGTKVSRVSCMEQKLQHDTGFFAGFRLTALWPARPQSMMNVGQKALATDSNEILVQKGNTCKFKHERCATPPPDGWRNLDEGTNKGNKDYTEEEQHRVQHQ